MSRWRTFFENLYPTEVSAADLRLPAAIGMVSMLSSEDFGAARLVAIRMGNVTNADACALLIDVEVSLGQRTPVNDIHEIEPLALVYAWPDYLATVFPLRDDFPADVPHFNLSIRDNPRSLCLFELPNEEAVRLATPFVLLERVRFWLKETAYGRLHGDDQPLDPMFMAGGYSVILPAAPMELGWSDLFLACAVSEHKEAPIHLIRVNEKFRSVKPEHVKSSLVLVTPALPHGRIQMIPQNLAELVEAFEERGLDIIALMHTSLRKWPSIAHFNGLLDQQCFIVIRTPLETAPGVVGGESVKAFFTQCAAGQLAEDVGAFYRTDGFAGQLIRPPPPDREVLRKSALTPMDVFRSFSRETALQASGSTLEATDLAVALVGAGALGSQIGLTAARMGFGIWTVIDSDYLLPHNMARHGLTHEYVGWAKADALAREIQCLLGEEAAKALVARAQEQRSEPALAEASLVIDASASVPVSRWLATASTHNGRTVSAFLNPSGSDLVLLAEGEGRTPRLDHVEMSYYWALIKGDLPEDHLQDGRVGLFPSGGCRTPSLAISQANIGTLAPYAVKRLVRDHLSSNAMIEVRRVDDDGVSLFTAQASFFREAAVGNWTISVSAQLLEQVEADRNHAGHLETGGILIGAWDRSRHHAYIVGHFAPPPDSRFERTGFIRGAEGVYQTIDIVQRRTAGNLTYVGEWHTHPRGFRSTPSSDDKILLRWIGDVLRFSDVPPLMMIAGEDGLRVLVGDARTFALLPFECTGDDPHRPGQV